jgi:thiol-disulfide isomerase/thioredoxin
MVNPDGPVSQNEQDVALWRKRNEKIQKRGKVIKSVVISLMAAVLIAALAYFNFGDAISAWFENETTTEQSTESETEVQTETESQNDGSQSNEDSATESQSESESETEVNIPEGNGVGNLCYGLDVPLIDSDAQSFNVSENRGKITVINFWGTWCTPCVNELPHFEAIAAQYKDTVTVVALHSDYASETAESFIDQKYPEHAMLFGIDTGETYYSMLGGKGMYPMTLVVDENGVIIYSQSGAMTYEQLKNIIDSALLD